MRCRLVGATPAIRIHSPRLRLIFAVADRRERERESVLPRGDKTCMGRVHGLEARHSAGLLNAPRLCTNGREMNLTDGWHERRGGSLMVRS